MEQAKSEATSDDKLGILGKLLAVVTLPQLGVLFIAPWVFIIPAAQFYQDMSAELPALTRFVISFRALPFMLAIPLLAMWSVGVFGLGPVSGKLRTRLLIGCFLCVQLVFTIIMLALLAPMQALAN